MTASLSTCGGYLSFAFSRSLSFSCSLSLSFSFSSSNWGLDLARCAILARLLFDKHCCCGWNWNCSCGWVWGAQPTGFPGLRSWIIIWGLTNLKPVFGGLMHLKLGGGGRAGGMTIASLNLRGSCIKLLCMSLRGSALWAAFPPEPRPLSCGPPRTDSRLLEMPEDWE